MYKAGQVSWTHSRSTFLAPMVSPTLECTISAMITVGREKVEQVRTKLGHRLLHSRNKYSHNVGQATQHILRQLLSNSIVMLAETRNVSEAALFRARRKSSTPLLRHGRDCCCCCKKRTRSTSGFTKPDGCVWILSERQSCHR